MKNLQAESQALKLRTEDGQVVRLQGGKRFRGEPIRFGKRAQREPIRFGKRESFEEVFEQPSLF
ncbi:unnamed protein product [Toxocara canis]|uniref:Type II toxin-antitoxin system prevent-host-death family antitoxin n=1 Tax=Toxocara canis TaxID=6265 RepID=A0A183TXW3_TOXCA|nr:unnamed protein product [Toxocara canis]